MPRTLFNNKLKTSEAEVAWGPTGSVSLNPCFSICLVAAIKRFELFSSMARKRNACASGTPSAQVCRNSTCAVTFPKVVRTAISPMVPGAIGPLESTAEPPLTDIRCNTPTKWL
jgi:hypothetical protein